MHNLFAERTLKLGEIISYSMLLTKGLKGQAIVWGKFIANGSLLGISYLAGFIFCLIYTWIYFSTGTTWPIVFGAGALVLLYLLLLAFFLFWGSISSKQSTVLLATVGCLVVLYLCNLHPAVSPYNPITLLNAGTALAVGNMQVGDLVGPFLGGVFLFNGLIWLTLGTGFLIKGILEQRNLSKLEQKDGFYEGTVLNIIPSHWIKIGSYITARVECSYKSSKADHLVRSGYYLFSPFDRIENLHAKIHVSEENPKKHYIELFYKGDKRILSVS